MPSKVNINTRLDKDYFEEKIVPLLMKELKIQNRLAVPRIKKVVLNMGVSTPQDKKAREKVLENIAEQFELIAGQKPQITLARQSIAGFKLREGDPLGVMVTLRGKKMWVFLQKLIMIALPRVKDFRGASPTAFDGAGNYSLGIKEQIIFPEVDYDKIESIRPMQVNIVTTTKSDEEAYALLKLIGMPFAKETNKKGKK